MSTPLNDRIAALKAKKDALAQRLNTLQQKAKGENRKIDTRRKIIVGGAVLAHMEKHPDFAKLVRTLLAASVGRQNDREAIADLLPPSSQSPAPQPAAPRSPDSAFGAR